MRPTKPHRPLIAPLSLLLLSTLGTAPSRASEKPFTTADFFIGHPAADFTFQDAAGQTLQLSSLKGHVVLLDFWETWCGPCRAEIPVIERLNAHFKKKDVVVLGVNIDEDDILVRHFVKANKISYSIVSTKNDNSVERNYGVRAFPTAVLIDKNGIIASYQIGATGLTEIILYDAINHALSDKYIAPVPRTMPVAPPSSPPPALKAASPLPRWQPSTAEEFLVRGYAYFRARQYTEAMADADQARDLQPGSYRPAFLHGRAAYEAKKYAIAIRDFDAVIQQRPAWPEGYHYRALAYSYSGHHQNALPDYQKFIELRPYAANGYNDIGWAYRELGQFSAAKANLDRAIDLEPDYVRAHGNRATLLARLNEWSAELAELSTILNLEPVNQWAKAAIEAAQHQCPPPETVSVSARTPQPDVQPKLISKVEAEYTDEARRAKVSARILCSLLVSTDGVPQDIQIVRGAGFGLDENAVHAVGLWRFQPGTAQGIPVPVKARVEVNFSLLAANHSGEHTSLNFTLPAGATRPQLVRGETPKVPLNAGHFTLRIALTVDKDGKPQALSITEGDAVPWAGGALRELESWRFRPATLNGEPVEVQGILEVQHGNVRTPPASDTRRAGPSLAWQPKTAADFLARGYSRLRTQKFPQAEADAEDALKLNPGNLAALFLHGRAALDDKDYATAIDDFTKVIDQNPNWPEAFRYRGSAYSSSGARERALADFQTAIELDPSLPSAYNGLGAAYLQLGQFDLAKQNLDKAIELEPDFITARENCAKLFAKQSDLSAEQTELTLLLALAPNNHWAKDEQEALTQKLALQ